MKRQWLLLFACLVTASVAGPPLGFAVTQSRPLPETGLTNPDRQDLAEQDLPFGAATSYLLGITLVKMGDFQGALPYLQHAYRLGPDSVEIASAYLTILLRLRLGPEALEVVDALTRLEPLDPVFWKQKIALLAEMSRFDEALQEIAALRELGVPANDLFVVEADLLAKCGREAEAVVAFRQALADSSADRERIYIFMARVLERLGRKAELEALWEEATTALPAARPLVFGRLRFLVDEGRLAEARELARWSDGISGSADSDSAGPAEATPFSWEYELVDLLVRAERYDQAIEILLARHEQGNLDLEPALLLMRLLVASDRVGEGLRLLRQLVQARPTSGRAHYFLGDLLASTGDLTAGEAELRRAVELEPREPDFLVSLVRVLLVRHRATLAGQPADSAAAAIRAEVGRLARQGTVLIGLDDHEGQMILGAALRRTGDLVRAREQFSAAAEDPANRRDALLQLAICQQEAGDPEAAGRTLEKLRLEYPDDPEVANALGYFLAEQGVQLTRAENLIREALKAHPGEGAFIDSLGWVLFQQGFYQAAFDQLVQAANALPDDPVILEHLGLVLRALEQPAEALRVLKHALAVGADPARISGVIEELENEDR